VDQIQILATFLGHLDLLASLGLDSSAVKFIVNSSLGDGNDCIKFKQWELEELGNWRILISEHSYGAHYTQFQGSKA
jgi:hypothetical protein